MSDWNVEVRNALDSNDPVFRALYDEHRQYELRVSELSQKPVLSFDEEIEEKHLKKKKLALKDKMAAHIRGMALSRSA